MMGPLQVRLALRDRPMSDVLDLVFRFVAHHFGFYLRTMLVVLVPGYALSLFAADQAGWTFGWIVAVALAIFAQAPFTVLASKLVFEDAPTVRQACGAALAQLPRLLIARLGQAAMVALGTLTCGVGLVYVAPASLFLSEAVLLEGISLGDAATRARRIAASSGGDSLMAALLLALGWLAAVFLFGDFMGRKVLEELLEISPPPSFVSEGGSYLALAGFWLFVPFAATARFLLYLNMRTKAEGWDVQAKFLALTVRAREAA
ncbi:MAG TPA: hypothetical protein VF407_00325 [Polyangiaceae bacterium]